MDIKPRKPRERSIQVEGTTEMPIGEIVEMQQGTVFSAADKIICGALVLIVMTFAGSIWSLNGTLRTALKDQNDALVNALAEQNKTMRDELKDIRDAAREDRQLYLDRLENKLDDIEDKLDELN